MDAQEAYFYLAHAEDICDYKGYPVQVDVPDKSIILQSMVCGVPSFWSDSIVNVFGDPKYKAIFTDPFRKTEGRPNLDIINELLETTLEVHAPHIDIGVILSRIHTIGYYKPEKRFGSSGVRKAGDNSSFEFIHNFDDHNLSIGPFIRLFRGSIKPTEDEVHHYLNTHENNERFKREGLSEADILSFYGDPLFTFNFIDFVKEHPGIHYHLLCRDVPNYCRKGAAKRRELSAEVHGHSKGSTRKLVDYAKHLRVVNDIQSLENLIRTMTVSEIKLLFDDMIHTPKTYRTDSKSCDTRDSPVYFIRRIMDITKIDPFVFRDELVKAMNHCKVKGDTYSLAEAVIKQYTKKKRHSKKRSKTRSKSRSKSRSKRESL